METTDWEKVRRVMDQLPSLYRGILVLHFQQGFSHEVIAEMLDMTTNLSRVRVYRALRMLREALK